MIGAHGSLASVGAQSQLVVDHTDLMQQAIDAGVRMLDGVDGDNNGVIDLFAGELGVRGLDRQAPTSVVAKLVIEDGFR